jgi:Arc/MetJ family transcription regulator
MGRTNIVLDDRLVREGMKLTGIRTKRGLMQRALENLVRAQRVKEELLKLRGKVRWEGDLKKMRRGRIWSL